MYNIAKKQQVLTVEPEDYDGVTLRLRSTTESDVFQVMEDVGLTLGDIQEGVADLKPSAAIRLIELFKDHLIGIDGLTVGVGEEPFDADEEAHVESLPFDLKLEGASELITYPLVTDEMGKGSARREGPSHADSTPPDSSRPAKSASS